MVAALDAVLDQATDLCATGEAADLAQAMGLVIAAEVIADQLMDLLGIPDPDDDAGFTEPDDTGGDTAGDTVGQILYEGGTTAQNRNGMSVEYYETLLALDERER